MKYNILLVDDNENFVKILKTYLELKKFSVDVAYDGEEGLNLWKNNPYDVIILDVKMPKIDGVEVLKRIKKQQPEIKIIIISGEVSTKELIDYININAFRFLKKPFSNDELVLAINEALNSRSIILKRLEKSVDESKNPNEKVFQRGEKSYSIRELYDEVRMSTEDGKKYYKSLEETILESNSYNIDELDIDEILK